MSKLRRLIEALKSPKLLPVDHIVNADKAFDDKVALVSGGTGGIGLAIAKLLIQSGCRTIIAGTNLKKLNDIHNELDVPTVVLDYAKPDTIETSINETINIYGHIDIFISSAGVHTENVDFWSMTPDEFERVMKINLEGTFFACQAIGKYMKENKIHGHILLISSSRGSEPAWSPYGISKWGMKGLVEGVAQMLSPYGINVNAIAPGTTATGLVGYKQGDSIYCDDNRFHRLFLPDEVANLARFLVSDGAQMISGDTVHISGGRGTFDIR